MKRKYIDLMEKALSAYTLEHIERYFDDVRKNGLTEHGFSRLTANIGILIAHGRCTSLKELFLEMMEFCCESIPKVRAANNFSVREIISCINEIEKSGVASQNTVDGWKEHLRTIDPKACYELIADFPTDKVKNWALFAALSEIFRKRNGLGGSDEWIDIQIATQLQWMDENGMYMDAEGDVHHPMMYDIVVRALFSLLLNAGYQGRYYNEIDDYLRRSGTLTLKMQSPNGETAFGGRSNQFIHCEPWMMAVYEYEASRYASEGNYALAASFKSAIRRALDVTEKWLNEKPIRHIKNCFPTESRFGCEEYAYFDKYMITVASAIYSAYMISDETIAYTSEVDNAPTVFATSEHFHKLFVKAGEYGLEFDFNADPHYDACGLGRLHRAGAPSQICLSVPCPSDPVYKLDIKDVAPLSLCPAVYNNGEWLFATSNDTRYEMIASHQDENNAYVSIASHFECGMDVVARYTVDASGVEIQVSGNGSIGYMLPPSPLTENVIPRSQRNITAFVFHTTAGHAEYMFDGVISDTGRITANRNGYYKIYNVAKMDQIRIKVEITKNV